MRHRSFGLLLIAAGPALAQDTVQVKMSGFVDGYYAFDLNRPISRDRAYTTQPARHNEFNINLALLDATLTGSRVRGRLAVQFGTSVQANYAGEPRVGSISGPDVSRYLQEAVAGVRIASKVWVDAGIYFSHIGSEGWISRDNLTYTRSLIADYTPYYQAGARVTWQPSPTLIAQLNVVNGWQNISETNDDKAIGVRVDWALTPKATLSAYNLIGNEAPDSVAAQRRVFHGASLKVTPSDRLTLVGTFDLGVQDRGDENVVWYGSALIAKARVRRNVAVVGRIERYDDPHQVIVVTGTINTFRATGASIGMDVSIDARVLWRSELRGLDGTRAVFPDRAGTTRSSAFLVTSLALTF